MTQDGSDTSNVVVTEGEPSEIVCTAIGARPAVEIRWYHKTNGGSESTITEGVGSTEEDNGDGTFDTVGTLNYTASRNYNDGQLRCQTYGQQVAASREHISALNVRWATPPTITTEGPSQYPGLGGVDLTLNISAVCVPEPPSNNVQVMIKVDGVEVKEDTVIALPPSGCLEIECTITKGSFVASTRRNVCTDGSDPESGFRGGVQQSQTSRQATPQPYMELDPRTREQNPEAQSQLPDAQSSMYEDIGDDGNTKDRAYQELGQPAQPPARDNSQAQAYVNVNQMQKGKRGKRR
ncbi:uncharacterized protein [Amphiura filiformis]|uniref:uncharacterized protein isoform X2 n=1 Tax=Amphiura filiformis TaxID=82378 RepID=UPI003B2205A4